MSAKLTLKRLDITHSTFGQLFVPLSQLRIFSYNENVILKKNILLIMKKSHQALCHKYHDQVFECELELKVMTPFLYTARRNIKVYSMKEC